MTDTERETLCARIDELCAEVERLHADQWGEGFNAGCDAANAALKESVEHYKAENAKLRELARFIMHQCNDGNPRCGECIGWNDGECVALLRMRELVVDE